ncbi:MAG: 5-bromo-4-chloroindolyl phosphate hydrolysis family protein, partial [Pseudomonadota bacterium]
WPSGQRSCLVSHQAVRRMPSAFQATARKMARTVQEDPRDLTRARKYLGVYLEGARDATVKFVDLYTKKPEPDTRTAYVELLDDLQDNFAARTAKMMDDDRTDMDIEIKVLRDRLQREGLS